MVDLPLVHKDTAPLGDVKAIQIGVSCGTEEGGSSVRLRATRRSPCLPYPVLPTTLIRPSIRQQQIHGASPVWDGEGDEGGVSEGLQDEGLQIGQLGSVGEPGPPCPANHSVYKHGGQTRLRGCLPCSTAPASPFTPGITLHGPM